MLVQDYFQLDQPGNSLNPAHNLRRDGLGAAFFLVYGNAPAIADFSATFGGNTYPYVSKLSLDRPHASNVLAFYLNGRSIRTAFEGSPAGSP